MVTGLLKQETNMAESHDTYVNWLEAENHAFAGACERDLAVGVPTCPGWTMHDLLAHHASFQSWITTIVHDRLLDPFAPISIAPPDDDEISWYRSIGERLVATLRSAPPEASVWGVTDQQTVGAWARRQASETSVHRWDAQNATGVATPIAHADDYISEILEHLLPGLIARFGAPLPQGTLAIRATDSANTWTATSTIGCINSVPDHTPADVTLSGTASDLLLALWNRPSNTETNGDHDVLGQWRRALVGG